MRPRPKWMPHPALVVVVVIWGLNFSVIKVVLGYLEPSVAALARYLVMLPILFGIAALSRIDLTYPKGQRLRYVFAGFIANGLYMVFFLEGMRTAGAAQGAIVLATAPIWIGLFAILAGQERSTPRLVIGGLVAFSGAVIVIVGGGAEIEGNTTGALLVLISAVLWAWSVILMRPLVASGSPFGVFTLTFPGGLLALLPYGIVPLVKTDWSTIPLYGWLAFAYLVLAAGIGGFSLYYKGLADVGPAKTSVVQFFIPPTAALFAWAAFGESLTWLQILGMAVVVAGTMVASAGATSSRSSK